MLDLLAGYFKGEMDLYDFIIAIKHGMSMNDVRAQKVLRMFPELMKFIQPIYERPFRIKDLLYRKLHAQCVISEIVHRIRANLLTKEKPLQLLEFEEAIL